jgi:menaquinone-dependent protoporphyrinogen IX oxidase
MKAAIFFTGTYGSTAQYVKWISEATGFPIFDLRKTQPDPEKYELLILGSSVFVGKLTISKWVHRNQAKLANKRIILFSVSGTAPGHPELQKYLEASLPPDIIQQMEYVPLWGRLDIKQLKWYTRLLLKIGASGEKDPDARKRMLEGFDGVARESIEPLLDLVAVLEEDHSPA